MKAVQIYSMLNILEYCTYEYVVSRIRHTIYIEMLPLKGGGGGASSSASEKTFLNTKTQLV